MIRLSQIHAFSIALLLAAFVAPCHGATEQDCMKSAPLIAPQPDGVICLNVEAAAIIKWNGKQAARVNDGGRMIKVENGRIVRWGGDEAHGLVVDRKPDNRYIGKLATGGKTEYCGQAGRNVTDSRFHTSARFDFAEAKQDAPYARHRRQYSDDYGLYRQAIPDGDPEPITDVTALRQTFGVRGEGLWIVCDHIENKGAKEREYTQFYSLPVRIAEAGFADRVRLLAAARVAMVEENEKERRIRTDNPGFDNVSLYCFAPAPLKLANVLNGKQEHDLLKASPLETIQVALKNGRSPDAFSKQAPVRPVSVRWNGAGNQVFVTALYSRPGGDDVAKQFDNDVREIQELKGEGGVMGCRAVTRTGAQVWFQSGPKPVNRLVCGPVAADAESLLVVKHPDGAMNGIVLGCAAMLIAGKPSAVPAPDFEFELVPQSNAINPQSAIRNPQFSIRNSQLIRRPIDTIRILPEQNVFTDSVNVSFEIPTQKTDDLEFRYTLDGADPTLESKLYAAPFSLDKTAMVKVRTFRKGLKQTPWRFTGVECGKTITAIFRKRPLMPARAAAADSAPGLKYEYFEGDWPTLFAYAGYEGVLQPKSSGVASALLDAPMLSKLRATDRAYAVRYDGWVKIPASGVYSFYAPIHLYTPTMDAGYDLRVFIDDEEWFPTPALHCENIWCAPLAEGSHRLKVAYLIIAGSNSETNFGWFGRKRKCGRAHPHWKFQDQARQSSQCPARG
ncbi:MAG: chitobiase/beta-hexosaminidase C-terminal domain-containing protein [Candidatus Sumerlaeota bacterium]|nr:chitobiase/beta-hexosaminidase C-terminal domain-containing protein [Candidatus Sumerlaeota bacterium]